jgi:hypothetical protein
VYERTLDLWREDAILIMEGKVDTRSERPQLVLDRVEEWVAPANGAPPPPPSPPPAAEEAKVNTAPPTTTINGSAKRVLRVDVPRGDDDNACLRVLEQLHGLIESNKGSDELVLFLRDRAGSVIQLDGAEILVAHSAELESRVRTIVGPENFSVR